MKTVVALVSLVAAILVAHVAGAQPAPDYDRCNALSPGRYRNQRLPAMVNAPLAPLGSAVDETLCDATYERVSTCGPPVVTNGPGPNQVTVTCAGPANTRPRRVHDRLVIVCREDLGLRDTDHGCELRPNLPAGYNYAIVRLSETRVDGRLTQRLRVEPHAVQETYGGVAWPNGEDRPQDARFRSEINGLLQGQTRMQTGINENRAEVQRAHTRLNEIRPQVQQNTEGLREVREQLNNLPPPPPPATRFGAGIGGFGLHAPGASDFGGFGLSLSLTHLPAGSAVGFTARLGLGGGFQPLVPGPGPLWSLFGSAQASFGRGFVVLNAGLAAGSLSRFGAAAPGQVAGNTAWFVAAAVGPEVRTSSFAFGVNFLVGVGQTAALAGDRALAPIGVPVGFNAYGVYAF